jgi:hypothetical protein
MDQHLPDWQSRRAELGILPLGHQVWDNEQDLGG